MTRYAVTVSICPWSLPCEKKVHVGESPLTVTVLQPRRQVANPSPELIFFFEAASKSRSDGAGIQLDSITNGLKIANRAGHSVVDALQPSGANTKLFVTLCGSKGC